jgi:hypothetical protein
MIQRSSGAQVKRRAVRRTETAEISYIGAVMKARCLAPSAIALAVGLLVASVGSSQELDEHLLLLKPLTGVTWLGHFVESPDSGLVHVVRWEPILDGAVIRSTKEVTTLNFRMETLYFWDWEKEEISFLQLTSKRSFQQGHCCGCRRRDWALWEEYTTQ